MEEETDKNLKLPTYLKEELDKIIREHDPGGSRHHILWLGLRCFDILHPLDEKPKEIREWVNAELIKRKKWEYSEGFRKFEKEK